MFDRQILALDLATTTGWALGAPGTTPRSGSIRFAGQRPQIYRALREWLGGFLTIEDIGIVIFESAAVPMVMQGKTNAEVIKRLIGMCEHVEEFCHRRVELREATVADVRIHFLGSNRNKRADAKRLTVAKCHGLGWYACDDNAGDALALWSYQCFLLRPDLAISRTPAFQGF